MPIAKIPRNEFVRAVKRRIGLAGADENWPNYRPEWVLGPDLSKNGKTVRGLGYDKNLRAAVWNRLNSYIRSIEPKAKLQVASFKADTTIKDCVEAAAGPVAQHIS
jgi:hypothetical protein